MYVERERKKDKKRKRKTSSPSHVYHVVCKSSAAAVRLPLFLFLSHSSSFSLFRFESGRGNRNIFFPSLNPMFGWMKEEMRGERPVVLFVWDCISISLLFLSLSSLLSLSLSLSLSHSIPEFRLFDALLHEKSFPPTANLFVLSSSDSCSISVPSVREWFFLLFPSHLSVSMWGSLRDYFLSLFSLSFVLSFYQMVLPSSRSGSNESEWVSISMGGRWDSYQSNCYRKVITK